MSSEGPLARSLAALSSFFVGDGTLKETLDRVAKLSQDLATAMRSRAVIEQAKGILMGAQRCSADEAFQILVRASQRENRKLRDIAEDLVSKVEQSNPPKG